MFAAKSGPSGAALRRLVRWPAARVALAFLALALVLGTSLAGLVAPSALALQTPPEPVRPNFELDGNVVDNAPAPPDWANLFTAGTDAIPPVAVSSLPAGFSAATFSRDFVPGANSDTTTYATGSKDILDINPGWQCSSSNNVGDKTDMLNSYAVIFRNPNVASPDLLVYYGIERGSNNGAGNVGFWLLQDQTVACDGSAGTTTFTGHHLNGDLLVVSEFTQGGSISTIKVFAWQFGAPNNLVTVADISTPEPNCLNPVPPATPLVCGVVNSKTNQPNDPGTAADDGLIATPWLTQPANNTLPKPVLPPGFTAGHTLADTEFYEGALNVTAALAAVTPPGTPPPNPCFAKFVPDTRSSPSTTATLFDFTVSSFASCPTTLNTTPTPASGTVPVTLNDSATLAGAVAPVGGSITFSLYGPFAADATITNGSCIDPPNAGANRLFTQTVPVTANGTYSTTGGFTATTPGQYAWAAAYSGDAGGNLASSSGCSLEVVPVGKATPAISTAQDVLPNDAATLAGVTGLPTPTGTVTFKLFPPTDPTCAGTPSFQEANVALLNGSAATSNTTFEVTAATASTYKWDVSYSGDTIYLPASKLCGAENFTLTIVN